MTAPAVCVLGAGGVGAATAAALLARGLPRALHLIDVDESSLAVLRMDLELLAQATCGVEVTAGTDVRAAAAADLVVQAASVPHRDGAARAEFAVRNLEIQDALLAVLAPEWAGTLLIAANPVEILATAAHRRLGGRATVLGYVRNDSLRLARAVGARLGVPAHRVRAWAAGEHGPGMVGPVGGAFADGAPVSLEPAQREEALAESLRWYDVWQAHRTGRTSVWTTGYGVAELAARYYAAERSTEPVCLPAPLPGLEPEAAPVCLGVPAVLGGGRAEAADFAYTGEELAALTASARSVAKTLATMP